MADPGRIRRVVVGPGGYGKSVLLDAVADVYRDAGFSVLRDVATDGEPLGAFARAADVALIVDDAHLLGAAELDRLAQLGAGSAVPLVVAHRPWPRSPALAALGALLAAGRAPVVLEALDRAGVAARAARLLRARPRPDLVDHVLELTAGMPGLVDRLLAALIALAPASDPTAVPLACHPPAGLLAQLGYTLESLGGGVLEMLLARAVGAPPDPDVLGALLGSTGGILDELTDAARATGLLAADGRPIPLVSVAVLAGISAARSLGLRRKLAEIELRRGGNVLVAARGLLGTGATGTELAAVFTSAAEEAVRAGSADAAELYAAAVAAGASALELAARRAEAAMLAGDLDVALNQADQVLSAADRLPTDDVVLAGLVAAAVLARRGMLARSAELYRWLGTATGAVAGSSEALLAVPVLIGTGALAQAREVLHRTSTSPTSGTPPTLRSGAEELMAQGILDSVDGSPTAALSKLARAAALLASSTRTALLPDTPAALAALVAVQCGELDVARSVLGEAIDSDPGGRTAATRHRLLLAWIATYRGATAQAQGLLAGIPGEGDLEPRDELLAAALEVAMARRTSDLGALTAAWGRAREAIVRHPVDLYSLQPLGELLVGAARLREQRWVAPHLDEAWAILDRLGTPTLWSVPLHWSCLQAGIAAGLSDVAGRHAAALAEVAESSRYATAMATAGGVWLRVLGGDVEAVAVDAAARGLHTVGLTWEGGRLAGQAAIRTHDRKDMSALLSCARALQVGTGAVAAPSAPSDGSVTVAPGQVRRGPGAEPIDGGPGALSDREREVAELVLAGMTYKQIGEQLFISAKTVEHHVSRMRQRLGSGSRGELFAQLRMVVGKSVGRAG